MLTLNQTKYYACFIEDKREIARNFVLSKHDFSQHNTFSSICIREIGNTILKYVYSTKVIICEDINTFAPLIQEYSTRLTSLYDDYDIKFKEYTEEEINKINYLKI